MNRRRQWLWSLVVACAAAVPCAHAQGPVLIKNVETREFSIHVGGFRTTDLQQVASREVSFYVENGADGIAEVISRETSLVISDSAPPPAITQTVVTVSPNGDSATLDWSAYNQWAVGDIERFDIYFTDDGPFTDVTGRPRYATVGGGATSITLEGLTPFVDHFFAVVAVDALGNIEPLVDYSAAYVLSPEAISREVSISVVDGPLADAGRIESREHSLVVVDSAPPPALTDVAITVSPIGDSALLDWTSYNQWAVGDIERFDIYLSDTGAFTDVTGLPRLLTVGGGETSVLIEGLTPLVDHFFAVVPVDGLENFDPLVNYAAAYVLSPETISREVSIHVQDGPLDSLARAESREYSILVPDPAIPAPVTGIGSGFFAETSTTDFGAVVLDWTTYNEEAQIDVIRYAIYVGTSFFDDVAGLAPFAHVGAGNQRVTQGGLPGGDILHFAVVAEDLLGGFDPVVRSFSAQASVSGVGEVVNLAVTGDATSLNYTWEAPPDTAAFLAGYNLYFDGATVPVELGPGEDSYAATGLNPATGYNLRITTRDVFGNESPGTSIIGATLLPNPANLALTAVGGNVLLLWDAVEPGALVQFYAIYESAAPITDITGLSPVTTAFGTSVVLGTFAETMDKHYAVATVNIVGASDPNVTSIQATKTAQTIDFPALTPGPLVIPLAATASSGLPVRFEAGPGLVATVDGTNLVVNQGGTVVVTAIQDGDADFWPAEEPQVLRLPPVIDTFTANGAELFDGIELTRNAELQVTARDADGFSQAEFFGRFPGETAWTSLGVDLSPGNGLKGTFPVETLPDGGYELRVVVTTTTAATAERIHAVTLDPQAILGITLGDTVEEGNTLTGQVTIQRTRPGDLVVVMGSSRPVQLDPGPPVTIPAGETSADFTVRAVQDEVIEALEDVTVSASAPGAVTGQSVVMIGDDDWPLLTLEVTPSKVPESAGMQGAIGRLVRDIVRPADLTVFLSSSDPSEATVPASVVIPANVSEVQFPVDIVDDEVADGAQVAQIQAEVRLGTGVVIVTSNPAPVEVEDDEGPTLKVVSAPTILLEGVSGEIVLRREDSNLGAGLEVQLINSDPGQLDAPATANFGVGEEETTIVVTGVEDGVEDGKTSVEVTASAVGHNPATAQVMVTDEVKPDLVVKNLSHPAEVLSDESFRVDYVVENPGSADAMGPFLQRVYLSDDPVLGNDIVLNQFTFEDTLTAGLFFGRGETVRAPTQPGTYWVIVTADDTRLIDELSEANNQVVSVTPIEVNPAFSAVVQTDVEVVPANTPLTFTGSATRPNGSPAEFVTVAIHICLDGTERVILALTNALGEFSTVWQPLTGEGGDYTIGASHPGEASAPVQDSFTILTLETEFPDLPVALTEGESTAVGATISNPTGQTLTGLAVTALDAPAGLVVTPQLLGPDELAPGASVGVQVDISADPGFSGGNVVTLQVTTDEGISLDIPVVINVAALEPDLAVVPDSLYCGVLRDNPKNLTFTVRNDGGAETGPIDLLLPSIPWLSAVSATPLPSLPPGGSADVTLRLAPDLTQPLTLFEGNLVLDPATGPSRPVPFRFRTVSDLTGDLEIEVVDEFFYFTPEAPKVEGANVVVRDALTGDAVASTVTGADGLATFADLPEGPYRVEVTEPGHVSFQQVFQVESGQPNQERVFISRNLVTYEWTVEEVEIDDRYTISVVTTFETNVPAPVVTVTPSRIDVSDLNQLGQRKVVNLTIENHGFIAAERGEFQFGSHPFYKFTPLITDVGKVPAKSSLIVPVTVERIGVYAPDGSILTLDGTPPPDLPPPPPGGGRTPVSCGISACFCWAYICGPNNVGKQSPVAVSGVEGHCPGAPGGPVAATGGGGPGAGFNAVSFAAPTICDCSVIPHFCLKGEVGMKLGPLSAALKNAILQLLAKTPYPIKVLKADVSWKVEGEICICCKDGCVDWEVKGKATAKVEIEVGLGAGAGIPDLNFDTGTWGAVSITGSVFAGAKASITGSVTVGGEKKCKDGLKICGEGKISGGIFLGGEAMGSATATLNNTNVVYGGMVKGSVGVRGSVEASVKACIGGPVEVKACGTLGVEAILSGELQAGTDDTKRTATFGGSIPLLGSCPSGGSSAPPPPPGSPPGINDPVIITVPPEDFFLTRDEVLALLGAEGVDNPGGVCATVKVQLDQDAVMTRSAFRATLQLNNNLDDASLTGVGFDLDVRDDFGQPAGDRFNVQVTRLEGLAAIDGTGEIGPSSTGLAQWTLVPRDSAAPVAPAVYTVGGTITYVQQGVPLTIPVQPVPITVRPDAKLRLKYFHQRDVYSDDPFTDEIEPAIPFALAVMVENAGAGDARNLSITSGQPEIVENDKGLLIDFKVIASQVAGQSLSPSLTADFGDLAPGERKIGTWLMTASLQGLFTDYEASFEHVNGLGDPALSLIESVEIHEMIRLIEAQGDKADGQPDFLVNDVPDINDYPDVVHLSDGSTAPVAVVEAATVSGPVDPGNLSVTITASVGTGWTYLRIADPGGGDFILTEVQRSDGRILPLDKNAWQTDRTFIGLGRRPLEEDILHLADCDSTGSYTLTYTPRGPGDTTTPMSEVTMLAGNSPTQIPVMWGGTDDTGIAFYDVFVSVDGGPFLPWFERTQRTSGIYDGEVGREYAFYSVATDFAGNREDAPAAGDTMTTVSVTNAAPVIETIDDQAVPEGGTLQLQVEASDPDGPDSALRYFVASTAEGVVIDPVTGILTYVTGEADGGTTVPVSVVVQDNGSPPESELEEFSIMVGEVNSPPLVAPVPPQALDAGAILVVDVDAIDIDLPGQTLSYSFGGPVPAGMTIDPDTGVVVWLADEDASGTTQMVKVMVEDDGVPAAASALEFSVTIAEPSDLPPVFGDIPVVLWVKGRQHSLTVSALDPDGDVVSLSADLAALSGAPNFQNVAPPGTGRLDWDTSGVGSGNYQVAVEAAANGLTTQAILSIRVEDDNLYWSWAAEDLAGSESLADFGMLSDPDGDGRLNVYEMSVLTNPLVADEFNIGASYLFDGPWAVAELSFHRRAGSQEFVRMFPTMSPDLAPGSWQEPGAASWEASVDAHGDDDGRPETENVLLRVFGFHPGGVPPAMHYRVEQEMIP